MILIPFCPFITFRSKISVCRRPARCLSGFIFFMCHVFTIPLYIYNDFPDNSRSNIQKPRRPSEMSAASGIE